MEYVIWSSISCSSKMGYASLSEWDPKNSFKLYHGFQITIIGIWFYQRIQICFPIGKWLNGLLCLSFYFGTFKVCVLEIRITCKMRNPIVGFNSCSSWTNDSFFFHLFSTIELFLPVGMWNVQEALPLGVILATLALEKVQRFQILGRIAAFLVS